MNDSVEKNMFYGAKPDIFKKAKKLRENMTDAEKKLWFTLCENKLMNFRFKPQHPIDIFIVDFYCHKLKLVLEVDGNVHNLKEQREYDKGREAELTYLGIKVVRFTNKEVLNDNRRTIDRIATICSERSWELLYVK